MRKIVLDVQPGGYTVARLHADARVPTALWDADGFVSATRTPGEVSVVAPTRDIRDAPVDRAESGWRLLTVRGSLEFHLTGIIAALAGELAAAAVPVFVVSTFDTDHILVKDTDLERAVSALQSAGHEIGSLL